MRQLTLSLHVLPGTDKSHPHNSSHTSVTRGPLTNASDTGSSMFRLFALLYQE